MTSERPRRPTKSITAMAAMLAAWCLLLTTGCSQRHNGTATAPWGETGDTAADAADRFDLDRILQNGEMIMLTLSGPDTYYDYKGRSLGTQYMLCQKFADQLGVRLRVEVCRDTVELLQRTANGDGDVAACLLPELAATDKDNDYGDGLIFCGARTDSLHASWAVSTAKPQLAEALDAWYTPDMPDMVRREEARMLSSGSTRRRTQAPMLDRKAGVISRYDALFMAAARTIRWDWRLLAAQCYQESAFDPKARSWAGACGLMQIMPATAAHLKLPQERIFDPESNIEAAARLLGELEGQLHDVADRSERISFVLACYNGGYNHIRDAMALARRDGRDPHRWADVAQYVLLLSTPQYYNDPIVKYGYMRGSETADYVEKVRSRWQSYRDVKGTGATVGTMEPRKAKHRNKKFD